VPVLLRKGIPATCFLNSAFIDNKGLFYRYKVCLLMNEISNNSRKLMPLVKKWLDDKKIRTSSYRYFLMKIDYNQRELADELAHQINFSFENYLQIKKPYLTTEQITGLIKKGFTFGSHSVDHPLYSDISDEAQIKQTADSTAEVTARFNLPYKVFSFPFTDAGVRAGFFRKTNASVHFDLTFGSAGMKKDGFPNHIQRIPVEYYDLTFRKRIKRDSFYYILKSPFNRNKVKRKG
jgi:peptidoglycan/xylan/chitin deacetylase (PgdA/CDA1 family)